ncbi:hypothetical protein Tco_0683864 [Tanacetum coccineum]
MLSEVHGVSLRITSGVRVSLRVADSHTDNHPEDDFTSLETIRRSYSVYRERIPFELEGETFEPERGGTGVDGKFNFLLEGGFEDNQGSFSAKSMNNETPILNEEPIYVVLPANVTNNIIDSSNTSSNDELPPVHPPISSFPEASKVTGDVSTPLDVDSDLDIHGKFEHVYRKQHLSDISIEQLCDIHDRAYMLQTILDNMLNSKTKELIFALHKAMASCDAIRDREVKRDKAHVELEKKCNEALQDLDKNPLVSDTHSEIKTLEVQVNGLHNEYGRLLIEERKWEIDMLRQDRATIVSKVVPDAAMKLVYRDEMGVLVARLVRAAIIHGRCTAFKEIAKLNEPFVLKKMSGYCMSSKDEYDRAREDMANASFPFLSEFTSNPYASVEQLLLIKP